MAAPTLNLVVLRVADLERAAAFYNGLGVTFEKHRHGTGPEHYATELAGAAFELYPLAEGAGSNVETRLGFCVDSVDDTLAKLLDDDSSALVASAKNSPWGRRAVVKDPDGYRIELTGRR